MDKQLKIYASFSNRIIPVGQLSEHDELVPLAVLFYPSRATWNHLTLWYILGCSMGPMAIIANL